MEKIQISKEQEEKVISYFKKRKDLWVVFFIIGIAGTATMGVTSYATSPSFVFIIIGIIFWVQSDNAIKKIGKSEYQVFKTKCKKAHTFLGYTSIENNKIVSKTVKKPLKKIEILGSSKDIQVGGEVGIIQVDKTFWAFPL
ncbi:MAG: hypothetical protein LBE37_15025 [Sphingobacterium sp.]|nr:hypothetical protein [Sphingobacterium sp.]